MLYTRYSVLGLCCVIQYLKIAFLKPIYEPWPTYSINQNHTNNLVEGYSCEFCKNYVLRHDGRRGKNALCALVNWTFTFYIKSSKDRTTLIKVWFSHLDKSKAPLYKTHMRTNVGGNTYYCVNKILVQWIDTNIYFLFCALECP